MSCGLQFLIYFLLFSDAGFLFCDFKCLFYIPIYSVSGFNWIYFLTSCCFWCSFNIFFTGLSFLILRFLMRFFASIRCFILRSSVNDAVFLWCGVFWFAFSYAFILFPLYAGSGFNLMHYLVLCGFSSGIFNFFSCIVLRVRVSDSVFIFLTCGFELSCYSVSNALIIIPFYADFGFNSMNYFAVLDLWCIF